MTADCFLAMGLSNLEYSIRCCGQYHPVKMWKTCESQGWGVLSNSNAPVWNDPLLKGALVFPFSDSLWGLIEIPLTCIKYCKGAIQNPPFQPCLYSSVHSCRFWWKESATWLHPTHFLFQLCATWFWGTVNTSRCDVDWRKRSVSYIILLCRLMWHQIFKPKHTSLNEGCVMSEFYGSLSLQTPKRICWSTESVFLF